MMAHNSTLKMQGWKSAGEVILTAGLIAGLLDGTAATVQTFLMSGKGIGRVFPYVASGVFGTEALSGGTNMIIAGILFHMMIAMTWAIIFFFLYPSISKVIKNWIFLGLIYGVFVWSMMNLVVVPLSNTPKFPFNPSRALIAASILMAFIGLPISFFISKYYRSLQK
jgi:hypothetical protein